MKFIDLQFQSHPMGGFGSHAEINGHTLSVQCGAGNYCSPREDLASPDEYESFEIAIWETAGNGPWCTRKFFKDGDDDIAGWLSREQIEEVISKLDAEQYYNETFKSE